MGEARKDGTVPAWVFYIIEPSLIDNLKGILTKALYENNFQNLVDNGTIQDAKGGKKADTNSSNVSGSDAGDTEWLESAMIADRQTNVDMENGSEIQDEEYDFKGSDDESKEEVDIDEMLDRYEQADIEESVIDEDLEPEFRDGENKECLQAMSYDRAFVVNGPVVKVYKNSEEEDQTDQQRLKYLMHLPVMKDDRGDILEPTNILLHNNESSILFVDKNDRNRLVNFDLEKGQIADDMHLGDELGELGISQVVNEYKNA